MKDKKLQEAENVKKTEDVEKIDKVYLVIEKVWHVTGLLVFPFFIFILTNWFLYNPLEYLDFDIAALNYLYYAFIMWILFCLIGRLRIAAMIETVAFMIFGLADYYVMQFRGTPILPWDVNSVGVAASVANNYDYTLPKYVWFILAGFLLLLILEFCCNMKITKFKIYFRAVPAIIIAIIAGVLTVDLKTDEMVYKIGFYRVLFQQDVMTRRNGVMLTFMYDLNFVKVNKPDGYSESKAKEYLSEYENGDDENAKEENQTENSKEDTQNTPDIIVIMDESFSDLSVLGDIETNEDYMPFIHSLQEGAQNTITGNLNVSVVGGNTPNTEYEFLTGDTMAFLPTGSIPYQQYMFGERDSLVSQLNDLGYDTAAMHPFYAKGWNRYNVYNYFGFDSITFKADLEYYSVLRNYVSDLTCTNWIINRSENAQEGVPQFTFCVTMQNHSSYSTVYDNLPQEVFVTGLENNDSVSNYFTLVKHTDEALEKLIEYYENSDRDTMIIFFGDHQPNTYVSYPILRQLGFDPDNLTVMENENRYKVPFVIWANFEIEEATNVDISANYLAEYALKTAGMELTPYQSFLDELRGEYPVLSAVRVKNSDNKRITDVSSEEDITKYNIIQYYKMFGE